MPEIVESRPVVGLLTSLMSALNGEFDCGYWGVSSGSDASLGAVRRNFMSPSPVALPARFLKKPAAVSTTPTFSATAAAIHWFPSMVGVLRKRLSGVDQFMTQCYDDVTWSTP